MGVHVLRRAVAARLRPAVVIASAGTVNTGAVDDQGDRVNDIGPSLRGSRSRRIKSRALRDDDVKGLSLFFVIPEGARERPAPGSTRPLRPSPDCCVDDLAAIADFAAAKGLWLHVDGCIGALLAIAPENAWRVAGLERADSLALDPHKWLPAPFAAGCVLVRDAALHRATFAAARNNWRRHRVAWRRRSGCTNTACRPRAASGRRRSGWR